jgi:hypothetical protein
MKKITPLVIAIISLLCSLQTSAKIWRVNNNPSLSADVLQGSTLFDGTNNATNPEAAAGDSIYFEPSGTVYNGFDINKANIVIIGYGYLLSQNAGLQVNANNAQISTLGFQVGSAGSSISGLEIPSYVYIYTSNVTITRCSTPTIYFGNQTNATGIRIDKCFIRGSLADGGLGAAVTNVTIAIENCIFSGLGDGNFIGGISLPNKVRGLIRNNVFNYCGSFFGYNFYVANNIFTTSTNFGNVTQSGNNVFRNNLFSYPTTNSNYTQVGGNTLPNSGNQFAVNMANVFNGPTDNVYNGTTTFNNYILLGTFTSESRYELKASSTAIAAGESGVTVGAATVTTPNCGAYGATDPYRKAGIPAIPTIYSLTVPPTVPNGAATMNISISSRSNN